MSEQLAIALDHRPALGAADFLIADSNREAVGWIDRWPDWPGGGVVVHGPAGAGKSHLVSVWRATAGAAMALAGEIGKADVPRLAGQALAIEDCDRGLDEHALLHLYNLQRESGHTLLMTARSAPSRWRLALPDLASRLRALPAVAIRPPDDVLLEAVIVKLLADRQLRVGRQVAQYVARRIERSFAAAALVVEALDEASLAERRNITVPLAGRVLSRLAAAPPTTD